MSSRLAVDGHGRLIVVVTTPTAAQPIGMRFVVLGDGLRCAEPGFYFTGASSGRPPFLADAPSRNGAARPARSSPRKWTDEHREEARGLQLEGLSWSQIAERVCGDKRFKSTVQLWLKRDAVALNGDGPETTPGPHQRSI